MTIKPYPMRILLLLSCFLFVGAAAHAQYTMRGRIEYERKVNVHKQWEESDWFERMKDQIPKFALNYFNLSFTTAASLYEPGKEVEPPKMSWGTPPGATNVVYQDYRSHVITASKQIWEQQFLIRDSLRRLKWRITDEIRTIANYKCRKAVTRICDSVYVVAFYTDDIPVSGGPEQFGGLPGMILELAVPRLYTTWVATKVETVVVKEDDLKAPVKGKKVKHGELVATLQQSLKDWGKYGYKYIWWSLL